MAQRRLQLVAGLGVLVVLVAGIVLAVAQPGNLGDGDTAHGNGNGQDQPVLTTSSTMATTTTAATVPPTTTPTPPTTGPTSGAGPSGDTSSDPGSAAGSGLATGGAGRVEQSALADTGGAPPTLALAGLALLALGLLARSRVSASGRI